MKQSAPLNQPGMEDINLGTGSFGYSTVSIDTLNDVGTQFTLVTVVMDVSPSTSPFIGEMEVTLANVVKACKMSPDVDNFLFRVVRFARDMDELHGFLPLAQIDEGRYAGALSNHRLGGSTSLYDAAVNCLGATRNEAKRLSAQDFDANACIIVITDGLNNTGAHDIPAVKRAFAHLVQEESCQSVLAILVGVNVGQDGDGDLERQEIRRKLAEFKDEAGFEQYVPLPDASPKTLALLGRFILKSMSSSSQAIKTGGPSRPVDINSI